jgi:hypothetical protein
LNLCLHSGTVLGARNWSAGCRKPSTCSRPDGRSNRSS